MDIGSGIFIGIVGGAICYGWFSNKSKKITEDEYNKNLRVRLEQEKTQFENDLRNKEVFMLEIREKLLSGFLQGRKWLASYIAEADSLNDEAISQYLKDKPHPAYGAAFEVKAAKVEKRRWKDRAKFLEYQVASYKEYFPFLEEFEDAILDESISLSSDSDNRDSIEKADPAIKYLARGEYEQLSDANRYQLALERYLSGNLSQSAVGKLYEQCIGYLYEKQGYSVEYHGIVKGLEDLGRDLICIKGTEVLIIQAKCWAAAKVIHEKHIFQLYGSTLLYRLNGQYKHASNAIPHFYTTTRLSDVAREAAKDLNVVVHEGVALNKAFPLIKCNINQATKEKIYHLPFDQQYDRTVITPTQGEVYALTVAEAESKGFRRAKRYFGPSA